MIMVDKSLIQKHGKKISPKIGDLVKIMRGDFTGREGKIVAVNRKTGYVYIDSIVRKNARGKENNVPIHHSKIKLINR